MRTSRAGKSREEPADGIAIFLLSHYAPNPELITRPNGFITIKLDLHHLLAGDAVVEFVLQRQEDLPRLYVYHFAAGGIGIFSIDAEQDPSGHILYRDGG